MRTAATAVASDEYEGAGAASSGAAAPTKKARARAPANTENFVRLDMRKGVAPGLRGKRNKKPKGQWRLKQAEERAAEGGSANGHERGSAAALAAAAARQRKKEEKFAGAGVDALDLCLDMLESATGKASGDGAASNAKGGGASSAGSGVSAGRVAADRRRSSALAKQTPRTAPEAVAAAAAAVRSATGGIGQQAGDGSASLLACAPLCFGHQQRSRLLKVRKAGPNKGRQFYACSLPRHDQCDFFMWAEDHPALVHAAVLDVSVDGSEAAQRSEEVAAEARWRARQLKASETRFQAMSTAELKTVLKRQGLARKGTKPELVSRLLDYLAEELAKQAQDGGVGGLGGVGGVVEQSNGGGGDSTDGGEAGKEGGVAGAGAGGSGSGNGTAFGGDGDDFVLDAATMALMDGHEASATDKAVGESTDNSTNKPTDKSTDKTAMAVDGEEEEDEEGGGEEDRDEESESESESESEEEDEEDDMGADRQRRSKRRKVNDSSSDDDEEEEEEEEDEEEEEEEVEDAATHAKPKPKRGSKSKSNAAAVTSTDTPTEPEPEVPVAVEAMLEKLWGHRRWRRGQRWGIAAVFGGRSALLCAPTGTGKSLCYQVLTCASEGPPWLWLCPRRLTRAITPLPDPHLTLDSTLVPLPSSLVPRPSSLVHPSCLRCFSRGSRSWCHPSSRSWKSS